MTDVQTIPNDVKVDHVYYTPQFNAVCAVAHDPFHGDIEIDIVPDDRLLEFISFEAWLKEELASEETTVEGVARAVFDKLTEALPSAEIIVTVNAKTQTHAPASASITSSEMLLRSLS